jgi:hypothetical protein
VLYLKRSLKRDIQILQMSKPSGATIDERVRRFAESVRNGEQGFKPGESWWLVRRTSKSNRNYKEAVTLCDQLGISEQEMGNHLNNTRWVGLIGDSLYTDYLRQGKVENFYFVTVTMENPTNATKSSSPIDDGSKVVMYDEGFRTTRTSKCPWMIFRDSICVTVIGWEQHQSLLLCTDGLSHEDLNFTFLFT